MATKPLVLGYYADWNNGLPPQRIDYRLFTHLTHAFAHVSEDGTLRLPTPASSRDLCSRAHSAGVRTLLALGGASSGPGLGAATATPDGTARLADQLAAVLRDAGYDGIDIDWEFPTSAAERDQVSALARALRERLPKATLTMAFPSGDWSGRWLDTAALLPAIDFINVMTYDYHGPWSDHAGHNAPLFYSPDEAHPACRANTLDGSMAYWTKQRNWPRQKLLLGIPLYGRGFRARKWGDPTKGSYERSEMAYRDIPRLQKDGWTRTWDDDAQVPTLQSPQQTEIISYDDETSARRKGRYARESGAGGIFFWEISQDYDGSSNPIVRASRAGFIG